MSEDRTMGVHFGSSDVDIADEIEKIAELAAGGNKSLVIRNAIKAAFGDEGAEQWLEERRELVEQLNPADPLDAPPGRGVTVSVT